MPYGKLQVSRNIRSKKDQILFYKESSLWEIKEFLEESSPEEGRRVPTHRVERINLDFTSCLDEARCFYKPTARTSHEWKPYKYYDGVMERITKLAEEYAKKLFEFAKPLMPIIIYSTLEDLILKLDYHSPVNLSEYWISRRFNNPIRFSQFYTI